MVEAHWETYLCNVDNHIAAMMVNLKLAEQAPMKELKVLNIISIDMNDKGEHGLGSEEERDIIYVIEDEIAEVVARLDACVYAGRCITQGEISMFFYRKNSDRMLEAVTAVMSNYADYTWTYSFKEEPQWNTYFDYLYPDEYSWNCITNEWGRRSLLEYGDNLDVPRPVDHIIHFPNDEKRASFIKEVEKRGFEVIKCGITEDDDENKPAMYREKLPYTLEISRQDAMNDSFNDVTWDLRTLARQYDGYYDGCGCFVAEVLEDDNNNLVLIK